MHAFEDSEAYATEEGDHTIHKCKEVEEDWEDHSAHLAELIAKVGRAQRGGAAPCCKRAAGSAVCLHACMSALPAWVS